MTRFMYVDGEDVGDRIRLDSIQLVEAAYGCDVGQGGLDRDDTALEGVPAMKPTVINETAASPTRMFTGYTHTRRVNRGPLGKVADNRQFDVALVDLNTLWDDPVLEGTDANRPEETDYARMTWLIGTDEFADLGITAGVVPNTNTVTLDARDYRGEHPRVVAEECMEAAAKNCFLYDYGSGKQVYYDLATGTSLSSSAKISSVHADYNEAGGVYAAKLPELELDPDRVYSKVRFEYAGGHVTVEDAGTAAAFRARAVTIRDDTVKNATRATNKANKYLARSDSERYRFTIAVSVPAANVNDIRAGQRIQMKLPHLSTDALDTSDYLWFRIARRTVTPAEPGAGGVWDRYTIALEFADDLLPAGFGGRGGEPGDTAAVADGAAVSLTRYQLFREVGGGPFGPAAGLWYTVDPDFSFGALASTDDSEVALQPEHNVAWPYTDCGVSTGAVGGLAIYEAWYRFTADLSDPSLVGVKVTIDDLTAGPGPNTAFANANGVVIGVHTGASSSGAELTTTGEWTEVGRVPLTGGEAFIPASLLIDVGDGYCWLVVAPAWTMTSGGLYCNADGQPLGHTSLGASTGGDAPSLAHAATVTASGSGLSPWLPALGDVDGTNQTFSLPLWNGDGVPEVRVGNTALAPGEYTYDSDTLEVTITPAPPADMAGQVAYRAQMG